MANILFLRFSATSSDVIFECTCTSADIVQHWWLLFLAKAQSEDHIGFCFSLHKNVITKYCHLWGTTTTTFLRPFFRDHPGEPVPEENFWTLWCKGRLTEADTSTIQLGSTPSGLASAYLHHPPNFLQAGCPSCRPTNSVKALKAFVRNCRL